MPPAAAAATARDDERIEYYHLISMKHVGDTLNLKILRDGQVGCWCMAESVAEFVAGWLGGHVLPVSLGARSLCLV